MSEGVRPPVVINPRGTSGSGKSTVVRRVMEHYGTVLPSHRPKRRQPYFYECTAEGVPRTLSVLGHYEIPCGGCDTITRIQEVYDLLRERLAQGQDVLFEGLMAQDDVRRAVELDQELKDHLSPSSLSGHLTVIELTTNIQECLNGVQARRDARGDARVLDPTNTVNRARTVARNCARLRAAGVDVVRLGREEAYVFCKELLGLKLS